MCVHHWHISEADGSTSEGVCIKCHRKTTFVNVCEPHISHILDQDSRGHLFTERNPRLKTWEVYDKRDTSREIVS